MKVEFLDVISVCFRLCEIWLYGIYWCWICVGGVLCDSYYVLVCMKVVEFGFMNDYSVICVR